MSTIKKRTFKKREYSSGDGMLTAIWGPGLWHFLHTMSFNYPVKPSVEDKKNYRAFVLNLRNVLPCKYCRQNLKRNLKANPLTMADMANRDKFSRFIYKLHETINKLLGKTSGLSYCDVRERYEHFRSRCTLDEKPKMFDLRKEKSKTLKKGKGKGKILEKGCTEPLYGKKAKCIIKIVPEEEKCKTLQIDKKCIKTRKLNV